MPRALVTRTGIGIVVIWAICLSVPAAKTPVAPRPGQAPSRKAPSIDLNASSATLPRAVISKYCLACHNERLKTAGLLLDRVDPDRVGNDAEVWERVGRKLPTGEMPPPGRARPDPAIYAATTASLEKALDDAAAAHPNPGRIAVHRLNRTEYTNAIRDLLALDIDGKSLLWADEPDQEGFDNVASVLSVSPARLEGYVSAARRISRLAIGDSTIQLVTDEFKIPTTLIQNDRMSEDLPFGSQGGTSVRYSFPVNGEYQIKVRLKRQLYLYIMGMGEPHQVEIRLDHAPVKRFTVRGAARGMTMPESFAGNTQGDPEFEEYMHTADADLEARLPVTAGTHEVSVSFVRRFWEPEGVLQPPQRGLRMARSVGRPVRVAYSKLSSIWC